MIAVIDYKAGNLTSVRLALEYLGVECEITRDPARLLAADRVIFPGVGAAGEAMRNLVGMDLIGPIREMVASGKPFLGICLGTQVIFERSEEDDPRVLKGDAETRGHGGLANSPAIVVPHG